MPRCIALLRGINVGRAKRVAMADLRQLFEELGHANVVTLLNSGNVVFDARRADLASMVTRIESRLQRRAGFAAKVVVLTAAELDAIIAHNALLGIAIDPSRHLVA